jgi:hypothetical protein
MGIIKIYHDKKWTLQFLDALYNSIDIDSDSNFMQFHHQLITNEPQTGNLNCS